MALIVVMWSLFTYFLVYHVVGQNNLTVTVDMNCRCKGINGFKTVNILWLPLSSQESASSVESSSYTVLFRTDTDRKTEEYELGCSVNTTRQSVLQEELHCSISSETVFPMSFYFILKMTNSSGSYVSQKKTCRLLRNVYCTKPQNFKVVESGKRNISVSWEPAPHMGPWFLCYRIWYASTQEKTNESVEIKPSMGDSLVRTFHDLRPYTQYRFFIHCSLPDCLNGWGALSGPVTGMTNEEVPERAPEFENWSVSNIKKDKRDVTVVWKLPPSNTWNGIPRKFQINFWQVSSQENGSSTPIPNSFENLQIKNGSVTTATLPALHRFADYQSQISMCTTQGCGPESTPWFLKGDPKPTKARLYGESNNASVTWIIVGTVSGVVVITVITVIIIAIRNWTRGRQRRNNPRPLEDVLQLDQPPLFNEIGDSMSTQNSYAEIPSQVPTQQVLRNHGDSPLDSNGD